MGPLTEKDGKSRQLAVADRQITILKSKILPAEPFLLLVDDGSPKIRADSNQHRGTPFEPYEVRHLQYFTMTSSRNRGLAYLCSNWQEEIESCSPAAIEIQCQGLTISSKSIKAPSKKISIADYKKLKKDGNLKPSIASTGEVGSRASSIISSEPMGRGPSSEMVQDPKITVKKSFEKGAEILKKQLADYKMEARRIALQTYHSSNANGDKIMNKNVSAPPTSSTKRTNEPSTTKVTLKSPLRTNIWNPLPSNFRSPRQNIGVKLSSSENRQPKPPLDRISPSLNQAQKRLKTNDSSNSTSTTDDSLMRKPKKPDHSKVSSGRVVRPPMKPSQPSPISQKVNTSENLPKISTQSNLIPIPPLLSPLPEDLDDSVELQIKSMKNTKKRKNLSPTNERQTAGSSNFQTNDLAAKETTGFSSPVFIHPPLLSPDLPAIVEEELSRLQKKNNSINNVEAKHEKACRADAPSTLKKNPKIGHPPKKTVDSNKIDLLKKKTSSTIPKDPYETKRSFVVKIKYKKRKAKDIERILRMTPKTSSARMRGIGTQRSIDLQEKTVSNNKHDVIGKAVKPNSTPVTGSGISKKLLFKKRASSNAEALSPPAKRSKTHSADAVKPQPSKEILKSPVNLILPRNNLPSTPKTSDIKSIDMHKISSTDSTNAQSPNVSTPVPAEKRTLASSATTFNTNSRSDANKYVSEALFLKRKMDAELKTKDVNARQNLSNHETKVGLCTGIECLLAYYSAFSIKKETRPIDRASSWESTLGLLEFVVRHAEPFLLLQTLAAQLNALVKEELNRNYLEHISVIKEASSELLEKMVRNSQSRDRYWTLASRGKDALKKIEFADSIVGPWTSWRDGRDYFLGVLTKYNDREKLGWKPSF
ncbi:hypothetical protein GcM1_239034 [Golovinomyces cichoracearum]|uniref:Uncharacterized protein n=1 Tax=Golovinomyces cichoracearum TaxID=62708 RepID=A0A420IIR1_9PEZI|nr:hypothetical protein GcM1_239034 [Golovinomyces cichoracearum]